MAEPAPARRRDINALAVLIVLIVLVIAGSYYWFKYRPTTLSNYCAASVPIKHDNPFASSSDYASPYYARTSPDYTECMRSHIFAH